MTSMRRTMSYLAAAALLFTLLPAIAPAAEKPTAVPNESPLYYLFDAGVLGYPAGEVSVRFEYRSGDHVLGTHKLRLSFGEADSLLVQVPPFLGVSFLAGDLPDVEIRVFADDLLLNTFGRESLVAYNRNLRYTHLDELNNALGSSGAGLRVEKPGPTNNIFCQSPCGGGCGPSDDYDCDGVNNSTDNCTDDANSNQADCDGDGFGDVCDGQNGIFQPSGSEKTCMTDKDNHIAYITFEHHVEQRLVDVTSCNSPDRWNRRVRSSGSCVGIGDQSCCLNGIGTSITQVGDSPTLWCGSSKRNIDFCH